MLAVHLDKLFVEHLTVLSHLRTRLLAKIRIAAHLETKDEEVSEHPGGYESCRTDRNDERELPRRSRRRGSRKISYEGEDCLSANNFPSCDSLLQFCSDVGSAV